jgi:hypothetical protein
MDGSSSLMLLFGHCPEDGRPAAMFPIVLVGLCCHMLRVAMVTHTQVHRIELLRSDGYM